MSESNNYFPGSPENGAGYTISPKAGEVQEYVAHPGGHVVDQLGVEPASIDELTAFKDEMRGTGPSITREEAQALHEAKIAQSRLWGLG